MIAIDILRWPGMNQAFIVSFVITTGMALAVIPYGKRRPVERVATWGEAVVGATYSFCIMFRAFGVVPHQFIDHADKELGWRKDKMLNGPFDLLKAKANGGNFPFTVSYEALRDIVVVGIYGLYVGLMVYLYAWWQKRGAAAAAQKDATSTYGRPLVRKA